MHCNKIKPFWRGVPQTVRLVQRGTTASGVHIAIADTRSKDYPQALISSAEPWELEKAEGLWELCIAAL